ncbi:MAG: 50S ribosomal protein L22 [Bacteroidetes bacterium]|nr:50S ribosomal protein L22 [Bacteroidota bacterium]
MGKRKHLVAEARKEARKTTYIAKLNDCPTSPRKMRLVADMVRGMDVYKALSILQFTPKHAAIRLEKLITSAVANFENKSGERAGDSNLYIKEVFVDSARQLKRLRPAPQGRGHRIRKRSNHITVILDNKVNNEETTNS